MSKPKYFMGEEVIELEGFNVDGKMFVSDSYKLGDYEKIKIILPKSMLAFLISDRGLLDDFENITVWGGEPRFKDKEDNENEY